MSVGSTVATAAKHHCVTRVRPWTLVGIELSGLLSDVEHHGGRLGHHEAVVVDYRHLAWKG